MEHQHKELIDDLHLSNLTIDKELLAKFIDTCTVYPYDWGAIFHLDNDVHIHVLSSCRHRVFLRKPLREAAKKLFKEFDLIKTAILKSRGEEVLNFDLRMGWKLVKQDETKWFLEMRKEDFKYADA